MSSSSRTSNTTKRAQHHEHEKGDGHQLNQSPAPPLDCSYGNRGCQTPHDDDQLHHSTADSSMEQGSAIDIDNSCRIHRSHSYDDPRKRRSKKSNRKRYYLKQTFDNDDDGAINGGPSCHDEDHNDVDFDSLHLSHSNAEAQELELGTRKRTMSASSYQQSHRQPQHQQRLELEQTDSQGDNCQISPVNPTTNKTRIINNNQMEEGNDEDEDDGEIDYAHQESAARIQRRHLLQKCFHIICPFAPVLQALLNCDMDRFWRIVPSIFVLKALYSSFLTLGLCTLFKVERTLTTYGTEDDDLGSTTMERTIEAYFFGLWTYTAKITTEHTITGFVKDEVERVETCRFHMNQVEDTEFMGLDGDSKTGDEQLPNPLFLNDGDVMMRLARAFAITTTGLGFISMVCLFLTAAKCRWSCAGGGAYGQQQQHDEEISHGHGGSSSKCGSDGCRTKCGKIWILFSMLLTCSILQSMVFLVLLSATCRNTEFDEERKCTLEEGSGLIFMSCFCWAFTAVASLKMPRNENNVANVMVHDDDDAIITLRTRRSSGDSGRGEYSHHACEHQQESDDDDDDDDSNNNRRYLNSDLERKGKREDDETVTVMSWDLSVRS